MSRAVVITVSDSRAAGAREDLSGPAVAQELTDAGYTVDAVLLIPDERPLLEAAFIRYSAHVSLVVSTGGTGIAPRDVTPEATRAVCDRILDGVGERMRAAGLAETPFAALSRALCGTRGQSLILNLPGSPQGAVTSLRAVLHLLPHALRLLQGGEVDHSAGQAARTPELTS